MKCVICNQEIIGKYIFDSWGQGAHAHHRITFCSSCGRIIGDEEPILQDGRCICKVCQHSIVTSPDQIDWLDKQVRHILCGVGIKDIPANIPIEIVNAEKLMLLQGSAVVNTNQRGLTVTRQQVTLFSSKIEHNIYVLDHQPKVAFAGVLAHEMLHAWQNQQGIKVEQDVCEGFCNLGSYAVYSSIGNEMSKHCIEQLEKSTDPIYGSGYRKVKHFLDKYSWEKVITKMKNKQ